MSDCTVLPNTAVRHCELWLSLENFPRAGRKWAFPARNDGLRAFPVLLRSAEADASLKGSLSGSP